MAGSRTSSSATPAGPSDAAGPGPTAVSPEAVAEPDAATVEEPERVDPAGGARSDPPAPLPRRLWAWFRDTSRGRATGAFLLYLVAALGIFGFPILAHPGSTFVGWGTDPSSFMWYLAWLPHALLHGINPLITHDVWSPVGFNLTHATAVYGPAFALMPVTLLFGPVVAYNVMALAAPVLAAWTAYLLCRAVTPSFPAALVGGYLFGFSVYVMGQMLGHPNLSLVFLVPVCALIVLRHVRGEWSSRRAALWLAAALIGQFLISLEVFMTLAIFGAVALALAAAVVRGSRREIVRTVGVVGVAYGITAVAMAPLLWSFFSASNHAPVYDFYPSIYASDLVNFALPTPLTVLGGQAFRSVSGQFTGDISEQSAYFGLPVLLMVGGFVIAFWRERWAKWLLGFVAIVALCSMGPILHVAGAETHALPWKAALDLPLVKYALPGRFMVYAWLGVAVMSAAWLGLGGGVGRWVLAAAAVAALYPQTTGPWWHNPIREPALFSTGAYRDVIPRGSNALVIPFGANGDSMLWQADTGFWFRMPVGNVGVRPPPEFGVWPATDALGSGQASDTTDTMLEAYLGANGVRTVIVADGTPGEWAKIFAPLGPPRHVGGTLVYTVTRSILRRYANLPRPPG
jgi:hypothetical protein